MPPSGLPGFRRLRVPGEPSGPIGITATGSAAGFGSGSGSPGSGGEYGGDYGGDSGGEGGVLKFSGGGSKMLQVTLLSNTFTFTGVAPGSIRPTWSYSLTDKITNPPTPLGPTGSPMTIGQVVNASSLISFQITHGIDWGNVFNYPGGTYNNTAILQVTPIGGNLTLSGISYGARFTPEGITLVPPASNSSVSGNMAPLSAPNIAVVANDIHNSNPVAAGGILLAGNPYLITFVQSATVQPYLVGTVSFGFLAIGNFTISFA